MYQVAGNNTDLFESRLVPTMASEAEGKKADTHNNPKQRSDNAKQQANKQYDKSSRHAPPGPGPNLRMLSLPPSSRCENEERTKGDQLCNCCDENESYSGEECLFAHFEHDEASQGYQGYVDTGKPVENGEAAS
jgi:hypothetical protein